MKRGLVLAIVLSLIFAVSAFAAPNYQEGLWEMTTTMNMPGHAEGDAAPHHEYDLHDQGECGTTAAAAKG